MTNNPLDDLAAELDTTMRCDVERQEWPRLLADGTRVSWTPNIPVAGPCPHPAEHYVTWRGCPCRTQILRVHLAGADINTMRTDRGLVVLGQFMCAWHHQLYSLDLPYPFICPGCGIIYQNASDMIVDVVPVSEA